MGNVANVQEALHFLSLLHKVCLWATDDLQPRVKQWLERVNAIPDSTFAGEEDSSCSDGECVALM